MDNEVEKEPLSIGTKSGYWFAAWAGVALVTLLFNPSAMAAALFFPAGLFGLFGNEESGIVAWMMGAWALGWVLYVVLTISMLRATKRSAFFQTYIVFCILLALNVAGCHRIISAASGIH